MILTKNDLIVEKNLALLSLMPDARDWNMHTVKLPFQNSKYVPALYIMLPLFPYVRTEERIGKHVFSPSHGHAYNCTNQFSSNTG